MGKRLIIGIIIGMVVTYLGLKIAIGWHSIDPGFGFVFTLPGGILGALVAYFSCPKVSKEVQVQRDPIAKLTELKNLLDSGALTQEEFDKMKAEILK